MSNVVVIIPIYKETLSHNESISLDRCRKILGSYKRVFIAPDNMRFDFIEDESVIYTKPVNLSSRKSYSDFVLSEEFYRLFEEYDYVLIYQLDVFVFEDKIQKYINEGYDYVGGAWLHGLECHTEDKVMWYIGNGGFSLRKVSAFLSWFSNCKEKIESLKLLLPEDLVISILGNNYLHMPTYDEALGFAFDINPKESYVTNFKHMPMACHAWQRFEPQFWKPIIDSYGYDMEIEGKESAETILLSKGKERNLLRKRFFDKSLIHKCLKEIISQYESDIYVYGAGQYGYSFSNMIDEEKVHICGYIDGDKSKWGKKVGKYHIFSPDILNGTEKILIALQEPEVIVDKLSQMGFCFGVNFTTSHLLQMKMIEIGRCK